jgi:hypothetical protein
MESLTASELEQRVLRRTLNAAVIAAATREIYQRVLQESAHLDKGNFTRFHPQDLRRMFDLYDERFFDGACRALLGETPLRFDISNRMTKSAGATSRYEQRHPSGELLRREYEIAISSLLLFQTFCGEEREVTVSGLVCHDRLEALQRVMEHEIVHLVEMLLWRDSSCAASRFRSIAARLFGHTQHTHALITPRERAWKDFGIRAGDWVRFRLDGQHYTGRVNRITRRATVLVRDPEGERYTDGNHYSKYYVPLTMLERLESEKDGTGDVSR